MSIGVTLGRRVPSLTGDRSFYNASGLKISVPMERVQLQTEVTIVGAQRMAQTRRMGIQNGSAQLPKAPRPPSQASARPSS